MARQTPPATLEDKLAQLQELAERPGAEVAYLVGRTVGIPRLIRGRR